MTWHWELYVIEAVLLAVFMMSAATFGVALFHERSLALRMLPPPLARRVFMGLAMGATAAILIYSPWGRLSGAHMNPAVTLAFASLGKIEVHDAFAYISAQTLGGVAGISIARLVLGDLLSHASVNYVATMPGRHGIRGAVLTELFIGFVQLLVVLLANNTASTHHATGIIAGGMVALWIVIAAPLSGMSMNPARSLASALLARQPKHLWVYLTIPIIAMQLAAGTYISLDRYVFCAKMDHTNSESCTFHCEFGALMGECNACSTSTADTRDREWQPTSRSIRTQTWCNPTADTPVTNPGAH